MVRIVQIQSGALIDGAAHLREGVGRDVSEAANFIERFHCSLMKLAASDTSLPTPNFIERFHCSLLRLDACTSLLDLRHISSGKCEQLDERPESETLSHEGHQNHAESDGHDDLACRKRRARSGLKRNGDGHHQRVASPEARPPQNYQSSPRWHRVASAKARACESWQVRSEKDPEQSRANHCGAYD